MTIQTALVRVVAIAALGLSASGCAANFYPTVEAGQPAAELNFHKSYSGTGLGLAALQSYNLGPDEFCDTIKIGASFTWTTDDSKALRVAPGKPVVLWVNTSYMWSSGGYGMSSNNCLNMVRFTPAQDHQYDVKHAFDLNDKYCRLIITDRATGRVVREGVEPLTLSECRKRAG